MPQRISDLLDEQTILVRMHATSKKRLLELLAESLAQRMPDLSASRIFESLVERERLGSTGMGDGLAIPHCRIPDGEGIHTAVATLDEPIDFDAPDKQPVDLLFVMVVRGDANQSHLDTLAQVANLYSDSGFRQKLRDAGSASQILELFREAGS